MKDDLIERLLAMYSHRGDALPTQYTNPDGPEAADELEALQAENERLRENLRHSQGRFLNINICLSSGGTKREAIAIADLGEDCIKGYLAYGRAALKETTND